MATYYARSAGGTWNAAASWDSASSAGAGPAGPPIAGDTAIFDAGSSGTITLTAAAACSVLNMSGHAGTLALAAYVITVAGNVTMGGTITATAGSGGIQVSAAATVDTGGIASFPGILTLSGTGAVSLTPTGTTINYLFQSGGAKTVTLGGALVCNYFDNRGNFGSTTFAGAYDITAGTLIYVSGSSVSLTWTAGQTITVNTAMTIVATGSSTATVVVTLKSGTASSDVFLHYNGAAADCRVSGITFTDVNCEHAIDNWYGGTLTRTTGITNRTSADIVDQSLADLTVGEAPTGKKFFAVSGGVKTGTGTKTLSNANETVAAGYYAATTLSAVDADLAAANIAVGTTIFGFEGSSAGGGGAINLDKMGAM